MTIFDSEYDITHLYSYHDNTEIALWRDGLVYMLRYGWYRVSIYPSLRMGARVVTQSEIATTLRSKARSGYMLIPWLLMVRSLWFYVSKPSRHIYQAF